MVKCTNCGAETTLKPDVTADLCPFCGSGIVATGSSKKTIKPQGLLPFKITQNQAADLFRAWVRSLWSAPNDLKSCGERCIIHGAYVPAWTYDSRTETDYTGQRGEDYWETETYTDAMPRGTPSCARGRFRRRWYPAAGHVTNSFDDLLILATRTLPRKYLQRLEPWDLPPSSFTMTSILAASSPRAIRWRWPKDSSKPRR